MFGPVAGAAGPERLFARIRLETYRSAAPALRTPLLSEAARKPQSYLHRSFPYMNNSPGRYRVDDAELLSNTGLSAKERVKSICA